jgi:hypothetical protein
MDIPLPYQAHIMTLADFASTQSPFSAICCTSHTAHTEQYRLDAKNALANGRLRATTEHL